jgi:FkbM family methyltransferase
MNLAKLLNRPLRSLGYELKRMPSYKKYSLDDIHRSVTRNEKPLIFDVGANKGQSITRFRKLFPQATIHAFEPLKAEFQNLKERYETDPSVVLNNIALGEECVERDFYVTAKSANSSFNKLNPASEWLKLRSSQFNTSAEGYTKEVQRTSIQTLDTYCAAAGIGAIDILKMDTQGYEDKVLEGAAQILAEKKVKTIETEIMFDDVYERHLSFYDIEKHLIKNSYRLVGIQNLGFQNLFEGYMFAINALYVNQD